MDVSEGTVSHVTNRIIEHVKEWQSRPLEAVYFTVWMDGIVLRVRQNGKYINKCIYLVVGLRQDGVKEVLGMWIAETGSASFWMSVLTDLKARGLEDILIACTGKLKGSADAIKGVFPQTVSKLCIVQQIRNSCKYVWRSGKLFIPPIPVKISTGVSKSILKLKISLLIIWQLKSCLSRYREHRKEMAHTHPKLGVHTPSVLNYL